MLSARSGYHPSTRLSRKLAVQAGASMMKSALIFALTMLTATGAALACSPSVVTETTVTRGESCRLSYASPDLFVSAGPAERVTDSIVRQFITAGACFGESIAVYYDCETSTGFWLSGDYDIMGMFLPDGVPVQEIPEMSSGPVDYFVQKVEPQLLPDLTIDRLAEKAGTLSWLPQKERLRQSRIAVEGKNFDLSCGCRLSAQ